MSKDNKKELDFSHDFPREVKRLITWYFDGEYSNGCKKDYQVGWATEKDDKMKPLDDYLINEHKCTPGECVVIDIWW